MDLFEASNATEDLEMLFDVEDGSVVTSVSTIEVHASSELPEAQSNDLKSLLESWGISSIYEILTAYGINTENIQYLRDHYFDLIVRENKQHLGSLVKFLELSKQWLTDSAPNSTPSTATPTPTPSTPNSTESEREFVDVLLLLRNTTEGRTFINKNRNQSLGDCLARKLVKIILTETFLRGMGLSRDCMQDIAKQICKIFKKEKEGTYYKQLPGRVPTGFLYVKYVNMRNDQLRRRREITSSESIQEEEEELVELDHYSTDDVDTSLKLIKEYTTDCNKDLLIEAWKKTFNYRQGKINQYKDVAELFKDWPPLKEENGYALMCMDFLQKYGLDVSIGINKWNGFFDKNLATITEMIKNVAMKKILKEMGSSTSLEIKNKNIVNALHHIFVPAITVFNKESWKPTIPMSQQSFLKTGAGQKVMLSDMSKRVQFCKKNGIEIHPMIYEIVTCMGTRYHVCINDVWYKIDSLVEAIEVAYKAFKTLNINFPPESKKVWKFIETIFYGETDISGQLLSIRFLCFEIIPAPKKKKE